jgi:hypothetical protein
MTMHQKNYLLHSDQHTHIHTHTHTHTHTHIQPPPKVSRSSTYHYLSSFSSSFFLSNWSWTTNQFCDPLRDYSGKLHFEKHWCTVFKILELVCLNLVCVIPVFFCERKMSFAFQRTLDENRVHNHWFMHFIFNGTWIFRFMHITHRNLQLFWMCQISGMSCIICC